MTDPVTPAGPTGPDEPDEPVVESTAPDAGGLDALCALTRQLAEALPGPLERLVVRSGDQTVEVAWPVPQPASITYLPSPGTGPAVVGQPFTGSVAEMSPVGAAMGSPAAGLAADGDGRADDPTAIPDHSVCAPLVGVFYRAAEPGAQPFVAEGDPVEPGQDVAIIEAMKIMNRVTADRAGRIGKVLVADGEMVEFGQPLLTIEPAE